MNPIESIAHGLTRTFESEKGQTPYAKVENINDGRGYTCGWAGFTTADEEVVACVEEYTRLVPHNHLAALLDELRALRDGGSEDVARLHDLGFVTFWKDAATTTPFAKAYETVVSRLFGIPAHAYCSHLGFVLPVAYAILFDSLVQHGDDGDPDSVGAMLLRAQQENGGTTGPEVTFLHVFLEVRRQMLLSPFNKDTRDAWALSVSRVDALEAILNDNPHLNLPVKIKSSEYDEEIS